MLDAMYACVAYDSYEGNREDTSGASGPPLRPLWDAIAMCTPEMEQRAEAWLEENGATSLDDIIDFSLQEDFLDVLALKLVQRLKARRFLESPREPKSVGCTGRPGGSQAEPKRGQEKLQPPRQALAATTEGGARCPCPREESSSRGQRPRGILRRGRSCTSSTRRSGRVSFSADTKGGRGRPGEGSPAAPAPAPHALRPASVRPVPGTARRIAVAAEPSGAAQPVTAAKLTAGAAPSAAAQPVATPRATPAAQASAGVQPEAAQAAQAAGQPSAPSAACLRMPQHSVAGDGSAVAYTSGQAVEVYSHSNGSWVAAQVATVFPDGAVSVSYDNFKLQKDIPASALAVLLKPAKGTPALEQSAHVAVPATSDPFNGSGPTYSEGQAVSVYSHELGTWLDAQVLRMLPDGAVLTQCSPGCNLMALGCREQQLLMRPRDVARA
mmetsp:Transcript_78750/g.244455  ORF Transcript_78750/g.244455 Transcript_78750/m.244455 type:complete len:440 (-) Transcript_78750:195-1514(-)